MRKLYTVVVVRIVLIILLRYALENGKVTH